MMLFALILHALMSFFLLGALSHQAASMFNAGGKDRPMELLGSFVAVRGALYARAVVVTYVLTMLLGDVVYAPYRMDVKTMLFDLQLWSWSGLFEIKEHLVALGFFLLPAYWWSWRTPATDRNRSSRTWLTLLLTMIVWYALIVGHLLNNLKGVGVL